MTMAEHARVINLLCDHSGCMEYDKIVQSGAVDSVEDLESLLANSDMFTVLQQNKSKRMVLVTSKVRRCRNRECQESCRDLHLCVFHMLGQCNVQRCKYGHSLETEHNSRILREHGLQGLSKDQLRVLLLQNDTSLLPNVCVSYNKGSGEFGNCPEKEACRRLHVCDRYIRGLCDGSSECNKCHDFYEPHPMQTLQARRVSGQLIGCLLLIYRNILTLKDHRNALERPGTKCKMTSKTINKTKAPEYLQKNGGHFICLSFIRGICKYGDKCWRVHFAVPYKWEVEVDEGWIDLPDNEAIEREYSDPSKIHSVGNEPVCFDTMMVGVHRVRRLSTVSSVLEPSFSHTTKWIWYWKNEYNKWIQYGSVKEMHRLSSITSDELEKKYLQFLDSNTHDVVKFSAGKQFYELNFKDMKQRNEITSSEREVRRRPFFVSLLDVRNTRTRRGAYSTFRGVVPSFWDKTAVSESGFQRVLLDASHKDYIRVQEHFNKTMKDFNILSIERVQNKELWEDFQTKRERMKKANSEKKYREAERFLFHGTNTRNVDAICLQNFDMRVSGANATVYGQGSYFARDAKYSHDYTDHYSERKMFTCRVLVGQYTKGASHYRRPPAKDAAGNLYDSCVNDLREPTIYVVFERSQVYPEFLITYEKSMGSTGETLAAASSRTTRNTLSADSDSLGSLDSDDTSDFEIVTTKSVGFAASKSNLSVSSKPSQSLTSLSRLLREPDNSLHATGTIPVSSDSDNLLTAAKPSPDCSSVQSGIDDLTLTARTSNLATERTSQRLQQDSEFAKTLADSLDPFSYSPVKAKSVDASSSIFSSNIESETSVASKTSCYATHKQPPSDGFLTGSFSATRSSDNASQWLDDFDDVLNVRQTASVISTGSPHKANNSTSSSTSAGEELVTSLSNTGLPRKSAQDILASVKSPVSSYSDNQLLISGTSSLTGIRDTDTSRPKTDSTYAFRTNPDLFTTQRSQSSQQHSQKPVSPRQVETNFSDPLSALSSATPRPRNVSLDAFPSSSYSVTESSISVKYTTTSSSANEWPLAYGSSSSFNEKPPSPLSGTQTSQNRTSSQQQKNVLEARGKQEKKCHIQNYSTRWSYNQGPKVNVIGKYWGKNFSVSQDSECQHPIQLSSLKSTKTHREAAGSSAVMDSEEFVSQDFCLHDEQTELEDVCDEVTQLDLNETESEMDSCVVFEEESEMQIIKTELRLCRIQHCEGCNNLHLCKLFLFGECPSHNQRKECPFGHDLYSEHNIGVLCQHKLLELDCSELCITLLQNDTNLLPSVCLAYNEGSSKFGNCLKAESCKDLHVCESYIRGQCDGSSGCSRCHDIYEPHPLKTLQDNGVPSQLMSILLPIYKSMLTMADADRSTLNSSATAPEEKWICLFHFEKSCTLGDSCENEHFYLPYKWEQRHGESWNLLPDNEEVERAFCDPSKTHSDSSVPVHFDTMTRGSVEVRRLSTISSILDPSFALATKWIWYFEDEHGDWIQYESSQEENNISFMVSEFLEWKYQENRRAIIRFTTAGHSYKVNMQDMKQYKKQNGTEMRLRRRPRFLSAEDVQNAITREMESEDRSQSPQALSCDSDEADMSVTGFERVPLDSDTDQYKKTVARFYKTMRDFNLKSIEKVQNKDLWEVFKRHVNVIKQKNLGKENVKLLFHGTESKEIDAIFQQNNGLRFCHEQETAYGKGIYFTKDAKSSHSYTDKSGTQYMFLCQVFTGEYTTGHPSYIQPPLKDGENGIFYDSCVNDIKNPSIFVVFEKHQVYPMYLIQYEKRAESSPLPVSQNPFSLSTQTSFSKPYVFRQHSTRAFFPVLTYNTPTLLSAPKFNFTPMVRPPFFAHLKEINFQRSAARFPFPYYYRPSQVRAYSSPTWSQKQHGSHGGFRSMHSPRNDLAQAGTIASLRKDYAKYPVSKSVRSDRESRPTTIKQTPRPAGGLGPMKASASVSSDTKTSKAVKGQNARHQHSNSAESNSGLNPGTAYACTSTHANASKSVRNENAKAKRVPRPMTNSDAESSKSVGKNSRSSETQRTTPAGNSSKSSTSQTSGPAGNSSKSSTSRTSAPAGKGSKSSTSQTSGPAGNTSKSSTSRTSGPAGNSSKSSASRTSAPAGNSSKSSTSRSTKPAGNNSKSSKGRH
ncbi:uncharacterized protein Hap1MRO34_014864 [Clarias gariepinus]|uniref:uncharacterized protein LOC128534107 n=1 Tax=Clarias gariepinus TaxID=13013 RepID=UPI00234D3CF5|nr:uncharacterized protein LOC128534107 [Clarias gariepinus]